MRALRKYEGKQLILDARDILDRRKHKAEQLMHMQGTQLSYESPSGVRFYSDHPYQWVPQEDVSELLAQQQPSFTKAEHAQVEDYYTLDF